MKIDSKRILLGWLLVLAGAAVAGSIDVSVDNLPDSAIVKLVNTGKTLVYVDLVITECVNLKVSSCGQVETALGLSSQSRISSMVYAADPSKPFSFKTNVKLSGAFQASGSSQLSQPNCGNRGDVRLIKTSTDIPAVCIQNRQENWAVGPESSASLCARVVTPFSNGSPIPMERVKNMSACFCGKSAISGDMKCWTYYDRTYK